MYYETIIDYCCGLHHYIVLSNKAGVFNSSYGSTEWQWQITRNPYQFRNKPYTNYNTELNECTFIIELEKAKQKSYSFCIIISKE